MLIRLDLFVNYNYNIIINQRQQSTRTRGGASGVFRVYRLFILQIGGVERGESAGPGADDRSI